MKAGLLLICALWLGGCAPNHNTGQAGYVTLNDDLSPLIDNFNAHPDALKLVFIVGPT